MRRTSLAVLIAWMLVDVIGCDKGEPPAPAGPELVDRRVPGTAMTVSLPRQWVVEHPEPGPMPNPNPNAPNASKLELHTRTLFEARPSASSPTSLVPPLLMVLEDPWLPVGTTGVDYLVAQRAANQAVIGANVRHVDAEPTRREGRPTYHVRDEWTVKAPNGQSREVSQEALLFLETATTPDGAPAIHGYTVVLTMEKPEAQALEPVLRAILSSVRFDEKAPAK